MIASGAALSGPNRSSAVMQQRHEAHDSLDDFGTPCWAVRALTERLFPEGAQSLPQAKAGGLTAREPTANRGFMVRSLREVFGSVDAADIFDYGAGFVQGDYLFGPDPAPVDWTITNPPFRLAEQFIARAVRSSRAGVAVLVRSAFLEGEARHKLYQRHRPRLVLQFAERVVMHRGPPPDPNVAVAVTDPVSGQVKWKKPSTATAYCWLVFGPVAANACEIDWIAPSRKRLERAGDYLPRRRPGSESEGAT